MKTSSRKAIDQPPPQSPKRSSDAEPCDRHRNDRGLSIIELMVTMGLIAVMLGIASPGMPRGAFALWDANQQLLADLRRTRTDALTKGDHFRLSVTSATEYAEHRMRLVGGVWVADAAAVRSRTLPAGVTFSAGEGTSFEFNTRGLLVTPEAAASLQLLDSHSYATRQITVWPSGQVAPL
jgi:prepilin-type N-terminal cleavage/methylation domain-containing protein